jgi:hypothetical protein
MTHLANTNTNNNGQTEDNQDLAYYRKFIDLLDKLLASDSDYNISLSDITGEKPPTYFLEIANWNDPNLIQKLREDFLHDIVIENISEHQYHYNFNMSYREFSTLILPLIKKKINFPCLMHLCETVGFNEIMFQSLANSIGELKDLPKLFTYPVAYAIDEVNSRNHFDALVRNVKSRFFTAEQRDEPILDVQTIKDMFIHHIECCPNLKASLNSFIIYNSMKSLLQPQDVQEMLQHIYPDYQPKSMIAHASTQTYTLELDYEQVAAHNKFDSEFDMHQFLDFIIKQCNSQKVLNDIHAKSIISSHEVSKQYCAIYIQANSHQPVNLSMVEDVLIQSLLLAQDNPVVFKAKTNESKALFDKLYMRVRLDHHLPEHESLKAQSYKNKL